MASSKWSVIFRTSTLDVRWLPSPILFSLAVPTQRKNIVAFPLTIRTLWMSEADSSPPFLIWFPHFSETSCAEHLDPLERQKTRLVAGQKRNVAGVLHNHSIWPCLVSLLKAKTKTGRMHRSQAHRQWQYPSLDAVISGHCCLRAVSLLCSWFGLVSTRFATHPCARAHTHLRENLVKPACVWFTASQPCFDSSSALYTGTFLYSCLTSYQEEHFIHPITLYFTGEKNMPCTNGIYLV